MASIFTKIVQGEIPSYKIAETEDFYAFLDIFPLKKGHTLVIPKKEVDRFFEIDDDLMSGIMVFAKKVATAIQAAYPCDRVGVAVWGLEVPHAHIHLIPMNRMKDMDYKAPKLKLSKEEFEEIAARIRSFL